MNLSWFSVCYQHYTEMADVHFCSQCFENVPKIQIVCLESSSHFTDTWPIHKHYTCHMLCGVYMHIYQEPYVTSIFDGQPLKTPVFSNQNMGHQRVPGTPIHAMAMRNPGHPARNQCHSPSEKWVKKNATLKAIKICSRETNSFHAPENRPKRPKRKGSSLPTIHFQVRTVRLRGRVFPCVWYRDTLTKNLTYPHAMYVWVDDFSFSSLVGCGICDRSLEVSTEKLI